MTRAPLPAPPGGSLLSTPSSALSALYARWRQPLLRLLQRRLGSTSAAEDTAQQVFSNLLASGRMPAQGKELAYLGRAAEHVAIDHWRRSGGGKAPAITSIEDCTDEIGALAAPASHDPVHQAEQRQYLARLQEALAELPARQREAFTLHFIEGLTQQEVADHMGISLRMVSKHVGRAFAYCEMRLHYGSLPQMQRLHMTDPESGDAQDPEGSSLP